MSTDDDSAQLFGVVAHCNSHIAAFVTYLANASLNINQEYFIDGLEDLSEEGSNIERLLQNAIQPVLVNVVQKHPEIGALLAANLAYLKLALLGMSASNVIAKQRALDKILPQPTPNPIDPTKF